MTFWIDEGLIGSVCRKCQHWIFYDWYMCNKELNSDRNGFIVLPVTECEGFEERKIVGG